MAYAKRTIDAIHRLADAGKTQAEIASKLEISQAGVSNVLRARRRSEPVRGPVTIALEELLDGSRDFRAALALTLAGKLDTLAVSEAVGSGSAMPAFARELRELVDLNVSETEERAAQERAERVLAPLRALAVQ